MLYSFFWVIPGHLKFVPMFQNTLSHLHRRCKQEELSVLYLHKSSWQVSMFHSFKLGVSCVDTYFAEFVELLTDHRIYSGVDCDWCPMRWVSPLMCSVPAIACYVISVGLALLSDICNIMQSLNFMLYLYTCCRDIHALRYCNFKGHWILMGLLC